MTSAGWPSRFTPYGVVGTSHDLAAMDLLAADLVPDVQLPPGPARSAWLRSIARDAVIYGLPAALQYAHLFHHVVRPGRELNSWQHGRVLAAPGYGEFRTPNVDTLYSTAWLDLTGGPVEVTIPPMGERYYTINLFDAHSNAINLSTGTVGPDGGRILVVGPTWPGEPAAGVRVLRIGARFVWALMRIFVRSGADTAAVHALQDRVTLTSVADAARPLRPDEWPPVPEDDAFDGRSVLVALDEILRRNGHPIQDEALIAPFRALGVGGTVRLDPGSWADDVRHAVETGYEDAMALVHAALPCRGRAVGDAGWRLLSSGAYGYNYLHRAATNYVGLGGTTREESGPYTTVVDRDGRQLDGSAASYRLRFEPPPVDAFWSLTVYDLASRGLVANPIERYAINSLSEDLPWRPDGTVDIHVGIRPGPDGTAWLPAPDAPFYLVLRAYRGHPAVVDGQWVPCPVVPAAEEEIE